MPAETSFKGQKPAARERLNEMYTDIQKLKKKRKGVQPQTFLFCQNGIAVLYEIEAKLVGYVVPS